MTAAALSVLREEIINVGYPPGAIIDGYVFSDVFAPTPCDRKVALAAFTQSTPSYRNAALAVVNAEAHHASDIAVEHRALGAPLLFVIEAQDVTVWQVQLEASSRLIASAPIGQLPALFSAHREVWNPRAIHDAKSLSPFDSAYQLSFVDAGLMPAIAGEIHSRLNRLLGEMLAESFSVRVWPDHRLLFRAIFRLLAAKVLQDRGHELATRWNPSDIDSIFAVLCRHYMLPPLPGDRALSQGVVFNLAWNRLRETISFSNIAADDLAFVYEHTLVTPETRRYFGTHSTPRAVAEYVVNHLELWRHNASALKVYEPFAGAGVFMVAALSYLKNRLPPEWAEQQRHDFLVQRIVGDEIDPFAREVANLSLILADYPMANGWRIDEVDLFENDRITERARNANVILCNPPFQDFTPIERFKYQEASSRSLAKPIAALDAVLDAHPLALGFVLPRPFIEGKKYAAQRRRVEERYKKIEIVSLPDRTFKESAVRSALLIAHDRRGSGTEDATTSLRSTVVTARDRNRFLRSGEVSQSRAATRRFAGARGDLWIGVLDELWRFLADYPRFGTVASVHRGLGWHGDQSSAVRDEPKEGFSPGVPTARAVRQFALERPRLRFLDVRPDRVRRAGSLPWADQKILANAARLSRGPWCFAAVVDPSGLAASQQLFGIWPEANEDVPPIHALCALLNSPLGNAYVSAHSPPDRIRNTVVESMPIPSGDLQELDDLSREYARLVAKGPELFERRRDEIAADLLARIDAVALKAYDLPPRLERELLEYFRGAERPTLHPWTHWLPENFQPFIPLHRYLSDEYRTATSGWVLKVFKPLPEDEAAALREYMD